ncbi:hypothetical protein BH24ACT5_BH24ACT5_23480 [soil metagenome]
MSANRRLIALALCLFAVVGAQILGTPRNAGPDEPAHLIRGAGLVRGQVFGDPVGDRPLDAGPADVARADPDNPALRLYDVPAWVDQPDPTCFRFSPEQPASCAVVDDSAESGLISTASTSPVWSHVLPGLGTQLVHGPAAAWVARFLHAIVPVVLLAGTLSLLLEQRRRAALSAVVVATTPMVLFVFAVVNPSGPVAAGAIALWVTGDDIYRRGRTSWWLFTGAFMALVLPRDDGLLWAGLLVALLAFAWRQSPRRRLWNSSPIRVRVLAATTALVGAGWAVVNRGGLVPVAGPGGNQTFAEIVVQRTGRHIREAVGVVGWLDTAIPESMFALWFFAAGLVVMAGLVARNHRHVAAAGLALVAFVVVGWVLETVQGPSAGLFWQGRYALPMLIGFVLLAGIGDGIDAAIGRIAAAVPGVAGLVVWNVSFLQELRRWGVGASGSIRPWAWDTWGAPVPLPVLIVVHVVASVGLVVICVRAFAEPAADSVATIVHDPS